MWVGDEIYFASDRDMIMNLFVYDTNTKTIAKVTDWKDYDVRFPSTNGKWIVYEKGGFLFKLDPQTKQSEQIHITLGSDDIYARSERMDVGRKRRNSYSLSPDGKRMAITARGELFDVPVGQGVTRNLTRTPGSNDRSANWSPDGKYIAFIGDGTGETEVYLYDVAKGGAPVQITRNNDTYIRSLLWSPDSKHIYYTDRKNRIVEVDPVAKTKKTIAECPEAEFRSVDISRDSKWLAYTKPAENQMNVIYLRNLASGKEYPVTDRWYNSSAPTFSADGKYLIFSSDRDLNPIYSRIEWDYAYTDMSGTYMTMLAADTPSPLLPTDSHSSAKAEDPKPDPEADKDSAAKKKAKESEPAEIRIDPEGLSERIIKLPVSNARNYFCDGKKLWYTGQGGTHVFDFSTGKSDKCAESMIVYRAGDKKALLTGSVWKAVDFPASKVSGGEEVDVANMYATVDYSQEWPQIFDEVWRLPRRLLCGNMHGRDWNAIKEKYAVLLRMSRHGWI